MFGKKKKNITVVDINGIINSRKSVGSRYNHYELMEDLLDLEEDDKVVGVILRVNSPGGTAGTSYELYDMVKKLTKHKLVYATVTDAACSGAYLAISAVQKIYATPMSIVGSVGVLIELPDFQGIADKTGVKITTMKAGSMKDIGNPFRDMTPEETKHIQNMLTRDHETFMAIVLKHRPAIKRESLEDGLFFTGAESKNLGFVDTMGTFSDALEDMKAATNIEDVEYVCQETGFIQKIVSKLNLNLSVKLDSNFAEKYL